MTPGMGIGRWLFVILNAAFLIFAPASVTMAAAAEVEPVLEKLLLTWNHDKALYFTLQLRLEKDGPVAEEVHVGMSRHARTFEYLWPQRYKGDVLILDGLRLYLEEEHGHEAMRPTVFRDLMNRRLFWFAAHLFGDFWADFDTGELKPEVSNHRQYLFEERDPLAPVELLKVICDRRTNEPISGQVFDYERDEIWELEFENGNELEFGGQKHVFLSGLRVRTSDQKTYYLSISNMSIGELDHMLQGLAISHE